MLKMKEKEKLYFVELDGTVIGRTVPLSSTPKVGSWVNFDHERHCLCQGLVDGSTGIDHLIISSYLKACLARAS